MKATLAAVLLLVPFGVRAGDDDPSCDVTGPDHQYGGVNKTADACNQESDKYNLGRCQRRLNLVLKECHKQLDKGGGNSAELLQSIQQLENIQKSIKAQGQGQGDAQEEGGAVEPGGAQRNLRGGRDRSGTGGGGRRSGTNGQSLPEEEILAGGDDKKITSLGKEYLDSGKPQDAERVLDRALEINPGNSEALGLRGAARLAQERPEAALKDAGAALAIDPNNKLAREIQGYTHAIDQRPAGGRVKLTKPEFGNREPDLMPQGPREAGSNLSQAPPAGVAVQLPAVLSPAQRYLSEAARKFALGDYTGALLEATRAIQADPSNPKAWAWRARISNQLKNYESAIQDSNEALKLDPKDAAAWLERGYAEYQTGGYDAALTDIDRALVLDPKSGLGRLYRAMVLEKLGRIEEAIADYRRAAELDPGLGPLARQALARLTGSKAYEAKRQGSPSAKSFLWILSAVTGVFFLFEGGRRVFRPGWRTTGFQAPDADARDPSPRRGTLAPGTVLGDNFRIERELARGGMGIVYEATDLTLKRPVAIKHLRGDNQDIPQARERLLKEAQLAAKLKHGNLAQIYTVVEEVELYLVFELVEGEALDRLIGRQGKLSLGQAKQVAADICAALEHAHAHSVIHRDLKPSNVMMTKDGTCKVMDFGIAHEAKSMSKATQTAGWGTPPYMAPEQEMGSVSRESDLFALGVMTYEMLTGRMPYAGPNFLARKLGRDFTPATQVNPELPAEVDAFFAKALEPDPAERYSTAADFMKAFKVLGETPVRA